jgi:hypothetical protein
MSNFYDNLNVNGTLNISTLGTGTTISNLGIDSNGFVVSGVNVYIQILSLQDSPTQTIISQ